MKNYENRNVIHKNFGKGKTFIDYLKDNNEWHEEFFKC